MLIRASYTSATAATGGESAGRDAADPIRAVAESFGLGSPTGIDLPGEAGGLIAGRATKAAQWEERRDAWCAAAAAGYPELRASDPDLADEYTALDRENCESGGVWRQGDAINAVLAAAGYNCRLLLNWLRILLCLIASLILPRSSSTHRLQIA